MGKVPGMGGLNQMNNLRKMAKNAGMGAMGGGMPDMGRPCKYVWWNGREAHQHRKSLIVTNRKNEKSR